MNQIIFKNIWVFVPCHNEEGNIARLTESLLNLGIAGLHVAIIDDASKDATPVIADELCKKFPERVKVVHRTPPNGRALAGITGFTFCLDQGADAIVEMDADFSHDPQHIPEMLRALSADGVDVVLGSRFVPGGEDVRKSWFRNLVSTTSVAIFRTILGIRLTDMGSGFKIYRRAALESIDPKNLFSRKGIAISVESIFRVLKNGYRVKEVPIIFRDRTAGESKLTLNDFIEPAVIALKLARKLGRISHHAVI